jgi:spore germination protein GerM
MPIDDAPSAVDVQPRHQAGRSTPPEPRFLETGHVFLVDDSRLVEVERVLPRGQGVEGLLDALARGPTGAEALDGFRSALPVGASSLDGTIAGRVATVELPAGFDELGLVDQVLALGQIVYTLTGYDGVRSVVFTDGQDAAVPVPSATGRLLNRPVSRSDYASIAPR